MSTYWIRAGILLFLLLTSGCSVLTNYEQNATLAALTKQAEAGDPSAQVELGDVYERGLLGPKSNSDALRWFRKSAEQGSAEGAYRAAVLLQSAGEKTSEVRLLLEQASQSGYALAQLALANLLSGQNASDSSMATEIFSLYRSAAEQGLQEAQLNTAELLVAGAGVERNLETALEWYRRAADQGARSAQLAVGNFYLRGVHVPLDLQSAYQWYEKSALQGSIQAQANLGDLLTLDRYVSLQDFDAGAEWYKKAASTGHAHASARLGHLFEEGKGVPRDLSLAANWYLQAAEEGNASAQCRLGSLYFRGRGLPQNNREAQRWFERAAAQVPAGVTTLLGFIHYDCTEFDPGVVATRQF